MVSSSMPNTMSPRIPTSSATSSASTRSASSEVGALAVIRTLSPSMPLARKAMVAWPDASSSSIRPASSSARPDSLWPQVRSVRLRMTACTPARRCRSGSTVPETISCIS